MNLAKLEMRALLTALTRKVTRFHIEAEERALNNILRGFGKLIVNRRKWPHALVGERTSCIGASRGQTKSNPKR